MNSKQVFAFNVAVLESFPKGEEVITGYYDPQQQLWISAGGVSLGCAAGRSPQTTTISWRTGVYPNYKSDSEVTTECRFD